MKIQVEINSDGFLRDLADIKNYVRRDLGREAYEFFKDQTPVDSGNARRSTKYRDNNNRKIIDANYPYAGVLDKGRHMTNRGMRGSNQAPEGMSKPTQEFIEKELRKQIRKP